METLSPKMREALAMIGCRCFVEIRSLSRCVPSGAYETERVMDQINSLSDLGHNIPLWLNGHEEFSEDFFRGKLQKHVDAFPEIPTGIENSMLDFFNEVHAPPIIAIEWLGNREAAIFSQKGRRVMTTTKGHMAYRAEKLGLLLVGESAWVLLDSMSAIGTTTQMVYPDNIGISIDEKRFADLKSRALDLGWLEFNDGALLNPKKIGVWDGDILSNGEADYRVDYLIPEGRKRLDAIPWVTMPQGAKINPMADLSRLKKERIDWDAIEKARAEIAAKQSAAKAV